MMDKLPRFVQKRVSPSGDISFRYNPTKKWVDAGVVQRMELPSNVREMRKAAAELNKRIDAYVEENKHKQLKPSSTVEELVQYYYQSNDYQSLCDKAKSDYRYCLSELCSAIGSKQYRNVSSKTAKQLYEEWVKRGVQFANHVATAASRIYNYAITMEEAEVNPFRKIKRKRPVQRTTVWEHEHVITFLNTAYTRFEWRSIGLIVQMAYEWCQRLGDMRMLTWDDVDLHVKQLTLEQSKRRAKVYLPISDDLADMLAEQKKDFGFQKYVAPYHVPSKGAYHPYKLVQLSVVGRRVMQEAGLPDDLRMMDLRRTGVTQMVDSGVPLPQIMSVTGHNSIVSVKPYMKHTFDSANNALTTRNVTVKLDTGIQA